MIVVCVRFVVSGSLCIETSLAHVTILHLQPMLRRAHSLFDPQFFEKHICGIEDAAGVSPIRSRLAPEGNELIPLDPARCSLGVIPRVQVPAELRLRHARPLEIRAHLLAHFGTGVQYLEAVRLLAWQGDAAEIGTDIALLPASTIAQSRLLGNSETLGFAVVEEVERGVVCGCSGAFVRPVLGEEGVVRFVTYANRVAEFADFHGAGLDKGTDLTTDYIA